jgi:hypothetical protein
MTVMPKRTMKDIRVNWFRVIIDISVNGYTAAKIGTATGMSKATVLNWKQGAEPKHCDGERIIGLWCEVTGLRRENLPVISRYDYRA